MKKVPNKIKILHRTFDVKTKESDQYRGQIDFLKNRIELDPRMDVLQFKETLLHEVLHGLFAVMTIKDEDKEEEVVSKLSVGLTVVFKDNPKLMEFLSDRSK